MYVKKLTIENFRTFAKAEVELNYPCLVAKHTKVTPAIGNVTLFVGANGSGKTSVFQALSLAVLAPVIRHSGLRFDYFVRRPPSKSKRQSDTSSADSNTEIKAELIVNDEDTESLPKVTHLVGQAVVQRRGEIEVITPAKNDTEAWDLIHMNSSPAFFLVGYGANRRAANPEGYSERNRSLRYQRVASLFEDNFGLVPFTLGHQELTRAGHLEAARDILNKLLYNDISLTDRLDPERRPLFKANDVIQPYPALTDACRGYISWLWDLLVQMARVQPVNANFNVFRDLTGVVMVDEIDLFLHPDAQRLLVKELAMQFPKLQFLFSTHSPFVVRTLESENLRVVTRVGDASIINKYDEPTNNVPVEELLMSSYFRALPYTSGTA